MWSGSPLKLLCLGTGEYTLMSCGLSSAQFSCKHTYFLRRYFLSFVFLPLSLIASYPALYQLKLCLLCPTCHTRHALIIWQWLVACGELSTWFRHYFHRPLHAQHLTQLPGNMSVEREGDQALFQAYVPGSLSTLFPILHSPHMAAYAFDWQPCIHTVIVSALFWLFLFFLCLFYFIFRFRFNTRSTTCFIYTYIVETAVMTLLSFCSEKWKKKTHHFLFPGYWTFAEM